VCVELRINDGGFSKSAVHLYSASDPHATRAAVQMIHEVDGVDFINEDVDEAKYFYTMVAERKLQAALNHWNKHRSGYELRIRHLELSPVLSESDLRVGARERLAGVYDAEEEEEG